MDTDKAHGRGSKNKPTRKGSGLMSIFPGVDRLSAVYLWAIFMIVFTWLQPHLFLTVSTAQLVFTQGAVTATLALAFTVPLATNTFDLSVGETLSLSVVLMNWFELHLHWPVGVVAVLVVLAGAFIGFVNGIVVVKLRVNSLIATLGMLEILTAVQLFISQNKQLLAAFSPTFSKLGIGTLWKIPYLAIYLLVLACAVWFVLEHMPVGRRMFAVGGNIEAARLAGLRPNRIVWGSLVASGALSAFAGVMYTAYVGPYTGDVGSGFLFPALAAVFFGASQLQRRPNVWGTLIAYFALAYGIQGLSLSYGPGSFWVSPLFQGVALIVAVAVSVARGAVGSGATGQRVRRRLNKPPRPSDAPRGKTEVDHPPPVVMQDREVVAE